MLGEQPIHYEFYKKYSWAEQRQEIAPENKIAQSTEEFAGISNYFFQIHTKQ